MHSKKKSSGSTSKKSGNTAKEASSGKKKRGDTRKTSKKGADSKKPSRTKSASKKSAAKVSKKATVDDGVTRVVVTRAPRQAEWMCKELTAREYKAVSMPSIGIGPVTLDMETTEHLQALRDGRFSWLIVTSPNGVKYLHELLIEATGAAELPAGVQVAVQGPKTASLFKEMFSRPVDFIPIRSVSEALFEGLRNRRLAKDKYCIAAAGRTREVITRGLRQEGADVTQLTLYHTVPVEAESEVVEELSSIAPERIVFTFFSPSAFEAVYQQDTLAKLLPEAKIATIGQITSGAVEDRGLKVFMESSAQTEQDFVSQLDTMLRS